MKNKLTQVIKDYPNIGNQLTKNDLDALLEKYPYSQLLYHLRAMCNDISKSKLVDPQVTQLVARGISIPKAVPRQIIGIVETSKTELEQNTSEKNNKELPKNKPSKTVETPLEFDTTLNNMLKGVDINDHKLHLLIDKNKTPINIENQPLETNNIAEQAHEPPNITSESPKINATKARKPILEQKQLSYTEWLLELDSYDQKKVKKIKENANKSLQDSEIVTESLAKLYSKQGYKQKAIQAYEKLILIIPEKSAYFADQIKILKETK